MKILAFDTSTRFLSVALMEDNNSIARYQKDSSTTHSEALLPTIDRALKNVGWDITDIELISAGRGPGSFTGLRVGFSVLKALSAVLRCKIVTVPSMDAMVKNINSKKGVVAPLLDARKNKVYTAFYGYDDKNDGFIRTSEFMVIEINELLKKVNKHTYFFGDACVMYKDVLNGNKFSDILSCEDWYPKAEDIGRIGLKNLMIGGSEKAIDVLPLYLYDKECNITLGKDK